MSHSDILDLVERTAFVDTHEHLCEESKRLQLKTAGPEANFPPPDFSMLLAAYPPDDLTVAGLPAKDLDALFSHTLGPREKWRLIAPYYECTRQTGYMLAARETLRALFDEEDFTEDNVEAISQRLADGMCPGFYKYILRDVANIEYAQVNSLDGHPPLPLICETEQPDLLAQDLSIVILSSGFDVETGKRWSGREVHSLADWHGVIDWAFATYGPRAIAVKDQSAYQRALDYAPVSALEAAPFFNRHLADPTALSDAGRKAVQDHLFHYCIRKAVEYGLPVKLHTGYCAGRGGMDLGRVRNNLSDLCPIFQTHPDARFVLFHITYPYQDELIAIAKHYPNVWADMSWAWIINPLVGVRFVKEFLTAAPASKLLTFGGDYNIVELIAGHARIARRGLSQALSELVAEGWLDAKDIPALVPRLMNGNAHEVFDYAGMLKAWKRS